MDRSRFSTHKRLAFLLAGVLLVLLGILGGWHVLSRQAQWTVLDQAALENAGDAHLRSLSQRAEQCAGAHDFLWTGEPVELTNRLSSEAHAFLPVCAIAPADVPKYGDAAWEVEFSLLTTWDGEEPPAWVLSAHHLGRGGAPGLGPKALRLPVGAGAGPGNQHRPDRPRLALRRRGAVVRPHPGGRLPLE